MRKFYNLDEQRKLEIYNQVSAQSGLLSAAIEKDWWVSLALRAIFSLNFSENIVFKGGTSLSKGWKLIDRFSEDIDLVINRSFFGFNGDLSKHQITKLRKESCKFISNSFCGYLKNEIKDLGIFDFKLEVQAFDASDKDPVIIELHYPTLTEKSDYLPPRVLIEIGSRALIEPVEMRPIQTLLSETLLESSFIDQPINIPIVLPKRTFLEKAFLMHEEYQRPKEKIKLGRKSRHLYDLEKMMDTVHGLAALQDMELYNSIIKHRKRFSHLNGVDYSSHSPDKINFIPQDDLKKHLSLIILPCRKV